MQPKESRLSDFLNNPRRAMWKLAMPVMFGMLTMTIYSLADMFFVGKLGGDAITAVAFVMPLVFFALGITFGIGSGITAVIAKFIGEENKHQADNAAEHSILLGLVLGAIFTIGGLVFGSQLLTILGASGDVHQMGLGYFRILSFGFVFSVISVIFRSILTGEGDTKLPMIIQGFGTVLNIFLDPLFIFTFDLGVFGAGLATVVSQTITVLIFVYLLFFKKHAYVTFSPRDFSFSAKIVGKIMQIGIPASLSMIIMSFGSMIFNRILVLYGNDAVAGYTVAHRIDHIFFMPIGSIAQALVTLVGMFYGAKRFNLMRSIIFYGMARSIVISATLALIFWIYAEWIIAQFTAVDGIITVGKTYIRYLVFAYPLIAIGMTSGRVLQGLGKGLPMLVTTILRVIAISVPLSLAGIFWFDAPIEWIWTSMLISFFIAPLVAITWLLTNLKSIERASDFNPALKFSENI